MNKKIIYIAGCWDYCHEGHLNILQRAKELGGLLVVGVNSDAFIMKYKKMSMDNDENIRLNKIRSLNCVDIAFILENHESQSKYMDIFKPHYIVHGDDWTGDSLQVQMNISDAQMKEYSMEFLYLPYTKGISSTMLREKKKDS